MLRFICLGVAIIAAGFAHALIAQDVKVDMAVLDTGVVVVKAPSLTDTVVVDSLLEVPINSSGTVQMELRHEETSHGIIKFEVDNQGGISNVEWKPNEADTTEFKELDTARYELRGGDNELKLKGCHVALDLDEVDLKSFLLNYYDPVSGEYAESRDVWGYGEYELFPGNYLLTNVDNGSSIGFLLMDDCQVNPVVTWDDVHDDNPNPIHLHIEAYEVGLNLLRLKGMQAGLKLHLGSDDAAEVVGLSTEVAPLESDVKKEVRLMPGTYNVAYENAAGLHSLLEFRVLNATNRLSPELRWKDVAGGLTSGEFAKLEPGIVYVTPESAEGASEPPFEQVEAVLPYAVLKEKLDAGYYIARSEELKVRYDERYNESADLRFRILDQNNMEVALANPVPRTYGTNWITFPLPSGQFTVGQYYVLEVRSEKGDLSMLRFRYD